jgi:hypothetical protein
VFIYREENKKDSSGVAYKIECKGVSIGYLPDIKTLRGYLKDCNDDKQYSNLVEWGKAVKAIREQFKLDFNNLGQENWLGTIAEVLYTNGKEWIGFCDFSDLKEPAGWTLSQIAVTFPVEVF